MKYFENLHYAYSNHFGAFKKDSNINKGIKYERNNLSQL